MSAWAIELDDEHAKKLQKLAGDSWDDQCEYIEHHVKIWLDNVIADNVVDDK